MCIVVLQKSAKKGEDSADDDKVSSGSEHDSSDFSCWHCAESLFGRRFVNRETHPYCVNCYHDMFANTCDRCDKTITVDNQVRYWPVLGGKILFYRAW